MTVGCVTYSFFLKTLLIFVLSKFSRPFCLEKGMRVSFRIHCSKTVFWNQLYDSCHAFNGNAVFSQSRNFFLEIGILYWLSIHLNVIWFKLFRNLLMELCTRSAVQATFKRSFTVDTMVPYMGWNSMPLLSLMDCLYAFMVMWIETNMIDFFYLRVASWMSFDFSCQKTLAVHGNSGGVACSLFNDPAYPYSICWGGGIQQLIHWLWSSTL